MDIYNITLTAPLGVAVVVKGNANQNNCSLRLFSESGCDEGAYYPPQDVQIYGDKQVLELRNFCDHLLEIRAAKGEVKS